LQAWIAAKNRRQPQPYERIRFCDADANRSGRTDIAPRSPGVLDALLGSAPSPIVPLLGGTLLHDYVRQLHDLLMSGSSS